MFAKLKFAAIVAAVMACIGLCGCNNSDVNKKTVSQTTITSYNNNQSYIASQTEVVENETVPMSTSASKNNTTSKTNSASKTDSDTKTTTVVSQSSSVSSVKTSNTTNKNVSDTTSNQSTTNKDEPVVEPEIDITETLNAQLIISQMPQQDRVVFDKINKAINSYEKKVDFKTGEATQQQIENALLVTSLTNLDDNYVSPHYIISVDEFGNVTTLILEFTKTKKQQSEERQKLYKVIDEIISGCVAENDYEAVKYFHDEIVKRCRYDANAENMLSAYGCLVDGRAVCEGYAKAFIMLCTEYDIECLPITGNTTNTQGVTEPHMWNLVKLDDKWYHFDLTWNDPISTLGDDFIKYDYFAVSDELISLDHVITPIVYVDYPVCDDLQNDYFTRYGLVFDDVDVAVQEYERIVTEAVAKQERFVRIKLSDAEVYNQFKNKIFEKQSETTKEIFNIFAKAYENSGNTLFNPRRYGKIFADDKNIITIVLNYE